MPASLIIRRVHTFFIRGIIVSIMVCKASNGMIDSEGYEHQKRVVKDIINELYNSSWIKDRSLPYAPVNKETLIENAFASSEVMNEHSLIRKKVKNFIRSYIAQKGHHIVNTDVSRAYKICWVGITISVVFILAAACINYEIWKKCAL